MRQNSKPGTYQSMFLWRYNVKAMNQILFTSCRDTLFDLLADKKHMGGKPGIIASLQTWTRTLLLHPKACPDENQGPCLVTGIGLSSSGELKPAVKDFLLPYDVIKKFLKKQEFIAFRSFNGKQKDNLCALCVFAVNKYVNSSGRVRLKNPPRGAQRDVVSMLHRLPVL